MSIEVRLSTEPTPSSLISFNEPFIKLFISYLVSRLIWKCDVCMISEPILLSITALGSLKQVIRLPGEISSSTQFSFLKRKTYVIYQKNVVKWFLLQTLYDNFIVFLLSITNNRSVINKTLYEGDPVTTASFPKKETVPICSLKYINRNL